jgi:leucyl-tRNA synthetase
MVTHETYRAADGHWLAPEEVETRLGALVVTATGEPVTIGRVEKMSKSKKNTVDPGPIVEQYGADAVRWFMLSDSPPERDLPWSEAGIEGAWRCIQRLWRLIDTMSGAKGEDEALDRKLHRAIAGIGEDIEALSFNKALAKIHELSNAIEKAAPSASRDAAIRAIVTLAAPMAPHFAEEAWAHMGLPGLIADAPWPVADPALLIDDEVTIAIQINGKLRDTFNVAKGTARETLEALALASDKVTRLLDGQAPRKVIVVPDRLVNLVA